MEGEVGKTRLAEYKAIRPSYHLPARLKALFAEFPDADISAMGFPKDWDKETLWQ